MRIPVYIYCPSAHRLFKIDRCRGRCFKWRTPATEHTKMSQVAKAKQALLRSTRYLGTNCLLYIAIQYFSVRADDAKKKDTYLSRPIAKECQWGEGLEEVDR
jgi:hypothetical protein